MQKSSDGSYELTLLLVAATPAAFPRYDRPAGTAFRHADELSDLRSGSWMTGLAYPPPCTRRNMWTPRLSDAREIETSRGWNKRAEHLQPESGFHTHAQAAGLNNRLMRTFGVGREMFTDSRTTPTRL